MRISFLGTGTSQGVPIIGCKCDTCVSTDPKDKRLRSSVLIEHNDYNILIDVGPDFRQQMLARDVNKLDAILLTHEHNDHIIGMDDIRPFNFRQGGEMPIYGLKRVLDDIKAKFAYIFQPFPYPGSPKILCKEIIGGRSYSIFPDVVVKTIDVMHGTLPILGFRIENAAYITDASCIDDDVLQQLSGLDILIINALQFRKHYSHFTYKEAVKIAIQINAKETYLTHMSHELGRHENLKQKCPIHISPGYDGLVLII